MDLAHDLLAIERLLWTNDATVYAAIVFAETGVIRRETALAATKQENAEGRRWAEVNFDDVLASPLTRDGALLTIGVEARWEHDSSARRWPAALTSATMARGSSPFHQQTPIGSGAIVAVPNEVVDSSI